MSGICGIIQEMGELSSKNKAIVSDLISAGIDIKDLPTAENHLKDSGYNDTVIV